MEPNDKRELGIEDIPSEDYGDSLYYDDGEDLSEFVPGVKPLEGLNNERQEIWFKDGAEVIALPCIKHFKGPVPKTSIKRTRPCPQFQTFWDS